LVKVGEGKVDVCTAFDATRDKDALYVSVTGGLYFRRQIQGIVRELVGLLEPKQNLEW